MSIRVAVSQKKLDIDFRRYLILGACNPHLARQALGLVTVDFLPRFLDQAQHVTHAKNPRSHALGVKRFQRFERFATADEFDRTSGHFAC